MSMIVACCAAALRGRALLLYLALVLVAAYPARVVAAEWAPVVSPYGELFPALLLATQSAQAAPQSAVGELLGDPGGLVGAMVQAARADEDVRVVIRVPGYAAESVVQARLGQAGRRYALFPSVAWDRERLAAIDSAGSAVLEFELWRDGELVDSYRAAHKLHAANEAPYFLDDGAGSADLSWIFAAFVDEHDPLVARLLEQARASGIGAGFPGYGTGDAESVYRQVFALWLTLERHGIRYSALTKSASVRGKVWVQNVRTIEASLTDRAANCVDGSVLFASLLRAAGLDASLVLIPGHMFVRVALDAAGRDYVYLETTLLNDPKLRAPSRIVEVDLRVASDEASQRSFARFSAALVSGEAEYRRYAAHLGRSSSPDYRIVDISAARRLGVRSLAEKPTGSGSGVAAGPGAR